MPIYEYRCGSCGFQNEYLQRVSDPLLTECPECGKATFKKMLTAAGFHLKGSGWYVTDFKNGAAKPKTGKEKSGEKSEEKPAGKAADTPVESKKEEKKTEPASGSSTTPAGS